MTHEVITLMLWSQYSFILAALGTTVFSLFYGLSSPWYKTPVGRLIFLQAVCLAVAIDLTLAGQLWPPKPDDYVTWLWFQIVLISAIAFISMGFTILMIKLKRDQIKKNHLQKEHNYDNSGQPGSEAQDPASQQPSI